MQSMSSAEVRQAFLDYFEEMGHRQVPSSSLVPADDPTLLFVNAGMVQFKDVFLGLDKRNYSRATTSQKCMRVSGKHNDLENVGPSPRHHTFFEMLGNFSFGDYFKRDAIKYAFQLLTEVYKLPAERLVFTVYENDDEAYDCWVNEVGVSPKRVARMGPSTNFWQMADTGPCGPTSEIHWDKQPSAGEDDIIAMLQAEDDRFLEIWNLVFMQFNRQQADPEHSGRWDVPLPAPGVDTGMGFERITSILQGVEANYETDLFMPIIKRTQELTGHSDEERDANIVPYRVIADHIRAALFLISDGVFPGAKGRAAIPRIVIRRAVRFGAMIGFERPFLAQVADTAIEIMGEHFQELVEQADSIKRVITLEEERFRLTMERGLVELDDMLAKLEPSGALEGVDAFYLKATLGLPFQVTKDVAEERGFSVDEAGFASAEAEHARISGGGQAMGEIESGDFYKDLLGTLREEGALGDTGVDYNPYDDAPRESSVLALIQNNRLVDRALLGEKVEVVLGATNFYVESGGQVSDTGLIAADNWAIEVESMKQPVAGFVVHVGEVVEGNPETGDSVVARVDRERRGDIIRNHTATHLLHAALRKHLGNHVQQKGSLVAPDRLRFDFSHPEKLSDSELARVAREINRALLSNYEVTAAKKSLEEARNEGAIALFGEKYGDVVRIVVIESDKERYSYELCGGVHVRSTAEIGSFVFTGEGSVSAGVRRVEALTGTAASVYVGERMALVDEIAQQLGASPDSLANRLGGLQRELASARREIDALRRELAKSSFDEMLDTQLESINGKQGLVVRLDAVPMETMREMTDWFRNRVDKGVMVLASDIDGRPQIVVAVTDALVEDGLRAGDLIKPIAQVVGGGGGGRPQMAQAGGKDSSKISDALARARDLIAKA
ncbi:MAG: alanine--tRNA ligase [Chloroflexota bacterium]|nr:alanine--tRNA ligase [Chloroflexota bacterium]